MAEFLFRIFVMLVIIAVFFVIVIQMAKVPWLSIAVVLVGGLTCCHAKASARDLPNPNDLDVSLFLLCVIVIVLLWCIWKVEDYVNRTKARERKLVDDAKPYRTPKQRAEDEDEWERWLREGRG